MSAKVFISHSSADQKVARAICSALENRGLGCWIAGRDVGPGENFQEAIVRAIRSASIMVLVFSENANNSHEIRKELVLAGQNNLVIIPARVENVAPNDALAYEFATRQWVDLFEDWEREIERLSAWIAGILSIEPRTAASFASAAAVPSLTLRPKNPLHHFAGAFLLILGTYLLVVLMSDVVEMPVTATCPGQDRIDCIMNTPTQGRFRDDLLGITLASLSIGWRVVISFIVVAATMAAGLGTIGRRNWARFLGLGICGVGLLISAYLTFVTATAAYRGFAPVDPFSVESIRRTDYAAVTDLLRVTISCLFVLAFVGAGAVYVWGWQSHLAPNPNEPRKAKIIGFAHRGFFFALFIILLCSLTSGAFYLYQLTQGEGDLLWNAVLIALDALVFTYCYVRFHKEFDSTGAAKVVPAQVQR